MIRSSVIMYYLYFICNFKNNFTLIRLYEENLLNNPGFYLRWQYGNTSIKQVRDKCTTRARPHTHKHTPTNTQIKAVFTLHLINIETGE